MFCYYLFVKLIIILYSFDENAESSCESAVKEAISHNPESLDAQQTYANLLLSQSKNEEAANIIIQVYNKIIEIRNILYKRTVIDDLINPLPVDQIGTHCLLYINQI